MTILLVLSVLFVLVVVFGSVLYVTRRDFRVDFGSPTPEQARVIVNAAEAKPAAESEAEAERIHHATLAENIRLAREYAERGMRNK